MEEQLIELYKEIRQISDRLNLSTYPKDIARFQKRYANLFESLRVYLETPDAPLDTLSRCVAEYVSGEMEAIHSKRKKEMARVDYNMAMVSYFLPLIRDIKSLRAEELAQAMADAWNETFPGNKISGMTIAEIKGGFRSSPCFITTAVCESLGKPDNCYELTLLRRYRNTYMMCSQQGARAVEEYYRIAPAIVEKIGSFQDSAAIYQSIWTQYLSPCIHSIEENRLSDCANIYTDMVNTLKLQYLS